MNRNKLVSGNLYSAIIGLTVPIVGGKFLQTGYNLIDTLCVSQLGTVEVGAVTFVMPIVLVILSIAAGLSFAGITIISQYTGAGNKVAVNNYACHLVLSGLVVSLVIAIVGYNWIYVFLRTLNLRGDLLVSTEEYARIIFLSTPFAFFNVIYESIRNSEGLARRAVIILMLSLVLNVIFNYLLIFICNMGIRGAGYATLIARGIASAYGVYDLLRSKSGLRINLKSFLFSSTAVKDILRIGIPSAIGRGTTALGIIYINIFIVGYGNIILAAYGIGTRINSLFFMPTSGFGFALATVIGQNLGAGEPGNARKAVRITMLYSMSFAFVSALLLYRFSYNLASLFSSDIVLIRHIIDFLKIVAITVIPWGVIQVMTGVFIGSGFAKSAMMISLMRLWLLRIPIMILLGRFTDLGEFSIWYSMLVGNTLTAIGSVVLYYCIPWDKGTIIRSSV